ncbi:MAG: AAA family ATPase [Candidatus Paceibacterota bacterium]
MVKLTNQILYYTKGLPASGKSTWAKEKAKEEPNTVIVNRDKIREMLKGEYHLFPFGSSMEKLVTDIEKSAIHNALVRGYNVIIDSTGFRLSKFNIEDYESEYNCIIKCIDFTNISVKECIKRDKQRGHSVGKNVITGMYNKYLKL